MANTQEREREKRNKQKKRSRQRHRKKRKTGRAMVSVREIDTHKHIERAGMMNLKERGRERERDET